MQMIIFLNIFKGADTGKNLSRDKNYLPTEINHCL